MNRVRERLVRLPTVVVLALVVAGSALTGVVGGGTMARWRDVERVGASMSAGVVVFGVGAPRPAGTAGGDYATGPGDPVEFSFGPAEAQELFADGAIYLPIQVDGLSQGHRGLRYTVSRTIAPNGVFADAAVQLLKVPSAEDCREGVVGQAVTASTLVPATYTATTDLTSEFWCLAATFSPVVTGSHSSEASVSADVVREDGTVAGSAGDTAGWGAEILRKYVPAAEGTHKVTFTFSTFRSSP